MAEPAVLYVEDVARLFGRSPKAIHHALARGQDWLPRPFRVGRRLAWRPSDIEAQIKMLARQSRLQ